MDLRIEDAEILPVEITADAREQIGLILDIYGDLQAFADRSQPALDYRVLAVGFIRKNPGLPCNIGCIVAQEIHNIELLPQAFVRWSTAIATGPIRGAVPRLTVRSSRPLRPSRIRSQVVVPSLAVT